MNGVRRSTENDFYDFDLDGRFVRTKSKRLEFNILNHTLKHIDLMKMKTYPSQALRHNEC